MSVSVARVLTALLLDAALDILGIAGLAGGVVVLVSVRWCSRIYSDKYTKIPGPDPQ